MQNLSWKRKYLVVLGLFPVMLFSVLAGCATGDEPMEGPGDTGRVEPPDTSLPKDTGSKIDVGGEEDLDVREVEDVRDLVDVAPGVDVAPVACGGSCTSKQVCESNVCVDVCARTGSQCGTVSWSGSEVQCGSCVAPSGCYENRCADNSGYRAITAGFSHTCATRAQDGSVRCWGSNSVGQLGNNQLGVDSNRPVGVHVLSAGVVHVNTHTDHTCAAHSNGEVFCWGKNTLGQLGNGNTTNAATPQKAVGISGAKVVAAGGAHACALSASSGEIQCWGEGAQGQLGTGTNSGATSAKPYVMGSLQTRLANNVDVGAGTAHSCSLTADGSVYCWGYNVRGQVGSPNTSYLWPTRVNNLEPVISLGVGATHTCAVTQAGAVKCWGEGESGQLGNKSRSQSAAPVLVLFDNNSVRIERVVAGGNHTCAIDSQRKAWCWGDNSRGQLGGELGNSSRDQPYPVSTLTDILTMSAGFNHTCAVRTNGVAYCWGDNVNGQLGDGTNTERNRPVMVGN